MRRAAAILAVTLALTACDATPAEPEGPPPPLCAAGQIDGEVILLSRPNHMSPKAIEDFETRYAVDVLELVYDSEEDLLSRVIAGADAFDVVLLPDYLAERLRRGGKLHPLDPIALPGTINIDPMFVAPVADGERFYAVPVVWGTIGIGLNVNAVEEGAEPSWGMLFDTDRAWRYAGRVSLLDDSRQVLAAAMLYLGYSPNSDVRAEVRQAADLVAEAQAHLGEFDSGAYASKVVEGGLDVAHGRSDVFLRTLPDPSTDFRYVIPEEGAVVWIDSLAVPTTARNPCSAHSFIDFALESKNAVEIANHAGAATPNISAGASISPHLAADTRIYPTPDVRSRLRLLVRTEELDRLYAEEFIGIDPP